MQSIQQDYWQVNNSGTAAAGTLGTATKAAGLAGIAHVCTGFLISIAAAAAPATTLMIYQILDGATVIWEGCIALLASAGDREWVNQNNLHLRGTPATAMTIAFLAGLASVRQDVCMEGYDAQ